MTTSTTLNHSQEHLFLLIIPIALIAIAVSYLYTKKATQKKPNPKKIPLSVNYHFTRACNYKCGFCFHTQLTSHVESLEEAKKGIFELKKAGMKKVNFAGGEPFLKPKFLGELCKFAKTEEPKLESVSIVSNGSLIKESWFKEYAKYVDILAVSCDSFVEETNIKIGRGTGNHLKGIQKVSTLCTKYNVKFKLNTVVNAYNWDEDMNKHISNLNPTRWKVFQVLIIQGENDGKDSLRNGQDFVISKEQFQMFLDRHKSIKALVPEDNTNMRSSYLILDEFMRFLDCSGDAKKPSESILVVGVDRALGQSGFDESMFQSRGGIYDWTNRVSQKSESGTPCSPKGSVIGDIEDLI